jgi:Fe2+ transport system protein FeoA
MTLADLKTGEQATIVSLSQASPVRQRLIDMGVLPGVPVVVVTRAPWGGGDPLVVAIKGYRLSLRKAEAAQIEVLPAA